MKRKKAPPVTREPKVPQNWPRGHVLVELTGADNDECVKVWIHGVTHYLHSTTARELHKMLSACLDEYNKIAKQHGIEGV